MLDETKIIDAICIGIDEYVLEESAYSKGFAPLTVDINDRNGYDKIFIKSFDKTRKIVTPTLWMKIAKGINFYMKMREYRIVNVTFNGMEMEIRFEFDEE